MEVSQKAAHDDEVPQKNEWNQSNDDWARLLRFFLVDRMKKAFRR